MRPGFAFWFWHLLLWLMILAIVQFAILSLWPSDLAQLTGALATAAGFAYTGIRVRLRVADGIVMISNPWSTCIMACSDVEAITPQAVRDKTGTSNCLSIRQRGAREGWPVMATYRLSNPNDGFVRRFLIGEEVLDVDRWNGVAEAIGVPIAAWPVNRAWTPGSYLRRRPPIGGPTAGIDG